MLLWHLEELLVGHRHLHLHLHGNLWLEVEHGLLIDNWSHDIWLVSIVNNLLAHILAQRILHKPVVVALLLLGLVTTLLLLIEEVNKLRV